MKRESVGLVILTKVKNIGWIAVLRRRGWLSIERMATQYYQGACQVTAHGKCKNGEGTIDALTREMWEELGYEFCSNLNLPTIAEKLTELNREETDEGIFTTYGIIVPFELVLKIRLDNPFDRLERLKKSQAFGGHIVKLKRGDKEHGISNMSMIAMFPDEMRAVELAFEKLVPRT